MVKMTTGAGTNRTIRSPCISITRKMSSTLITATTTPTRASCKNRYFGPSAGRERLFTVFDEEEGEEFSYRINSIHLYD